MNNLKNIVKEVDIVGQLADLKEIDYKNLLALTAVIELLIDKGILTREEIQNKTLKLDTNYILGDLQ